MWLSTNHTYRFFATIAKKDHRDDSLHEADMAVTILHDHGSYHGKYRTTSMSENYLEQLHKAWCIAFNCLHVGVPIERFDGLNVFVKRGILPRSTAKFPSHSPPKCLDDM